MRLKRIIVAVAGLAANYPKSRSREPERGAGSAPQIASQTIAESDQYRLWLDDYYSFLPSFFRRVPFLPALILALGPFLTGVALSARAGFLSNYLRTPPIYLGMFGIVLVTVSIRWGTQRLPEILGEIRTCFDVSDDAYGVFVHKWNRRFASGKGQALSIAPILMAAYGGVWCAFYLRDRAGTSGVIRYFHAFPDCWFDGQHYPEKLLLIGLYGLPVIALLVTGAWELIVNMLMLRQLMQFPMIRLPALLNSQLHRLGDFYLKTAATWSMGVALIVIFGFKVFDPVSGAVMLVTGLLGLAIFFYPQYLFHNSLGSVIDSMANEAYRLFRQSQNTTGRRSRSGTETELLAQLIAMSQPSGALVYDWGNIAVLVLSQLIPVALLGIKILL